MAIIKSDLEVPMADRLRSIAESELGETEDIREKSLTAVRQWLNEHEDSYEMDDVSLLWFLRSCKFDLEKTQQRIDNFHAWRAKVPEWYSNRDPTMPELAELAKLGLCLPFPGRDHEGRLVLLIRAAHHNPYKHKQDNVFKVFAVILISFAMHTGVCS